MIRVSQTVYKTYVYILYLSERDLFEYETVFILNSNRVINLLGCRKLKWGRMLVQRWASVTTSNMTRRRTTTTRVVENALTGRSRPLKAVVCGPFGLRWCAIAVNSWWGREIFYGEDSAPIVLHLPPHHSCFTKAFMHHSKTIDQVQRWIKKKRKTIKTKKNKCK